MNEDPLIIGCKLCPECKGCTIPHCIAFHACTCPASIRTGFGATPAGVTPAGVKPAGDPVNSAPRWHGGCPDCDRCSPFCPCGTPGQTECTEEMWSACKGRCEGHDDPAPAIPTTLAQQVGALVPFIAPASHPILHGIRKRMGMSANHIMRLVGERIVTGHAEHGCNLFTMSDADLAENLAEELADAIVYRSEQLRRKAGA